MLILWSCCNSIAAAESSLKPLQILKYLPESLTVLPRAFPVLTGHQQSPSGLCAHAPFVADTQPKTQMDVLHWRTHFQSKRYFQRDKQPPPPPPPRPACSNCLCAVNDLRGTKGAGGWEGEDSRWILIYKVKINMYGILFSNLNHFHYV